VKLVIHATAPVPIGSVQIMNRDAFGRRIEQPVLIQREATREEYVASVLAFGGDDSGAGRGPFFYEVATD
jgi:hypothetical protein